MAVVIILAYMSQLIASQILPEEDSSEQRVLNTAEFCFTVIFAVGAHFSDDVYTMMNM